MKTQIVKVRCCKCREYKAVVDYDRWIYSMIDPEDAICKQCKRASDIKQKEDEHENV